MDRLCVQADENDEDDEDDDNYDPTSHANGGASSSSNAAENGEADDQRAEDSAAAEEEDGSDMQIAWEALETCRRICEAGDISSSSDGTDDTDYLLSEVFYLDYVCHRCRACFLTALFRVFCIHRLIFVWVICYVSTVCLLMQWRSTRRASN